MGLCQYVTFAFMHPPYLVRILFGMPSLHLFTFLMFFISCFYTFLVLTSVTATPRSKKSILSSVWVTTTPEFEHHWQFNSGFKNVNVKHNLLARTWWRANLPSFVQLSSFTWQLTTVSRQLHDHPSVTKAVSRLFFSTAISKKLMQRLTHSISLGHNYVKRPCWLASFPGLLTYNAVASNALAGCDRELHVH